MSSTWPAEGLRRDGVVLRTWRMSDVPARCELDGDPEIYRWSPIPRDSDEATVTARMTAAVADATAVAAGEGLPMSLAIAVAGAPDQVLGSMDWRNTHPTPPFSVVDVGYAVLPSARGRGVASTALALLSDWLLSPGGADFHRVQLDHATENVGSCRTAARAGFVVEGQRAAYLPLRAAPGAEQVRHPVCLHGRVRG